MNAALTMTCSNKTRASTASGGGNQYWRREVYHLTADSQRTLCKVDCSEWLTIGPLDGEPNKDCCGRCRKHEAA